MPNGDFNKLLELLQEHLSRTAFKIRKLTKLLPFKVMSFTIHLLLI